MRHTVIVIPCLNEQDTLANTCASLGFGASAPTPPQSTTLVLVDNGSVDATLAASARIREASPAGTVILATENERGYVPPRHKGCLVAQELARTLNVEENSMLVLQADADTEYSSDYVDTMRAASVSRNSIMLQACTSYRTDFQTAQAAYLQLCSEVDAEFEKLLTDNPDDVIIDDKACGYVLADYFKWGGHNREYTEQGEEVYSETTRLYIRSQRHNTIRVFVEDASTEHSARHLIGHPIIDFVTAGFPRERSCIEYLKDRFAEIDNFENLVPGNTHPLLPVAVELRKKHLLALFGVLPLHIARISGRRSLLESEPWNKSIVLPSRPADTLYRPALLVEDVFRAVNINIPDGGDT